MYPLGGCCNYAPCLFPDGCCPDGCCPDGCCPNGCIGEQFKGCFMSIKGRPPWYAPAAVPETSVFCSNKKKDTATIFTATVAGIVDDEALSNDEVEQALKGVLYSLSEQKQQEEEERRIPGASQKSATKTSHIVNETSPAEDNDYNGDKDSKAKKKSLFSMFGVF